MQTTEHHRAADRTVGIAVAAGWLLDHVPAPPPGWLGFCFRTWLAIVLALSAAFWLELDSPSSAAVCVAILAQPTRGQAVSKAIYRMGGTVLGATVAVVMMHLFPQERFLFLGGVALWLAVCTFFATMTRDFRAYGAVLSGYTVAIVGVSEIDTPMQTFEEALTRAAVIALGIVATLLVNNAFGSPETWVQLSDSLRKQADKVFGIGEDALAGRPIPDPTEIADLTSTILGLRSQASFARTELLDGRQRIAAAASTILGLIDLLRCARALAHMPDRDPPEGSAAALYLADRTAALGRHRDFAEEGMRLLSDGGMPSRTVRLGAHHDLFSAGLNATRILLAFALGAAFSILSGLSDSTLALVQIAAVCALASTNPNPTGFAYGLVLGSPLAIVVGGLTQYLLLNHGSAMPLLAIALIPTVLIGCSLSMNAKTGVVGFITLVFTLVILSPANRQDFDPTSFVERSIMFIAAAAIMFLTLVLVLPVSPRRRLMRGLISVTDEVRATLDGSLRPGTRNSSRRYDRLSQIVLWNGKIGKPEHRRFVLERAIGLTDLIEAMTRAQVALQRARAVPALRDAAADAERALREAGRGVWRGPEGEDRVGQAIRSLVGADGALAPIEVELRRRAVSGLYGAARLLSANRRMLTLTGVIGSAR